MTQQQQLMTPPQLANFLEIDILTLKRMFELLRNKGVIKGAWNKNAAFTAENQSILIEKYKGMKTDGNPTPSVSNDNTEQQRQQQQLETERLQRIEQQRQQQQQLETERLQRIEQQRQQQQLETERQQRIEQQQQQQLETERQQRQIEQQRQLETERLQRQIEQQPTTTTPIVYNRNRLKLFCVSLAIINILVDVPSNVGKEWNILVLSVIICFIAPFVEYSYSDILIEIWDKVAVKRKGILQLFYNELFAIVLLTPAMLFQATNVQKAVNLTIKTETTWDGFLPFFVAFSYQLLGLMLTLHPRKAGDRNKNTL